MVSTAEQRLRSPTAAVQQSLHLAGVGCAQVVLHLFDWLRYAVGDAYSVVEGGEALYPEDGADHAEGGWKAVHVVSVAAGCGCAPCA